MSRTSHARRVGLALAPVPRTVKKVGAGNDALRGVASAATFARHMLCKDLLAARAVFDRVSADREELLAFATGLVTITNGVLTDEHGQRYAEEYLERLARGPDRSDELE
jgi:hypothetical protein